MTLPPCDPDLHGIAELGIYIILLDQDCGRGGGGVGDIELPSDQSQSFHFMLEVFFGFIIIPI